MPATTAFDLGPLSWVKGEIDAALERAGEALRQFGANPGDVTQAKLCRNHLHQVRGALTIVGLDGVTQFTDALEALLADLEAGSRSPDAPNLSLVSRALQSVRHYLDNLVAGEPNQPLRLFDLYRQIATARGESAPSASDLFFPDIGIRPTLPPAQPAPVGDELVAKLKTARARFQKGMLGWLKNSADVASVNECRAAAAAVGTCNPAPVLRAFWWTVSGLFAALAQRAIPLEAEVKPLLARIDQQIRQQIDGSRTVPERLMRDALFYVAIARCQLPEVMAIRNAYALDALIPTDNKPTSQTAQLEPLIRRLRDIARSVEENWSRFCGGNSTAIGAVQEAAAALSKGAEQVGLTDFKRLTQALATVTKWVADDKSRHNDAVAMETATAILLLSNTLDNFAHLGADFVHQVDVMVARLHACIAGNPPPAGAEVPMLDEMTRLAQEKLLIAQVVREIQSNLGQIEQALDTFFRDPDQRDQLKACQRPVAQIAGALTVLGQTDAVAALTHASERIAAFASPGYQAQHGDFEAVANQLSALGFFVEALRSGTPDYQKFVAALGQRSAAPSAVSGEGFAASVEEAEAIATQTLSAEAKAAALAEAPNLSAPPAGEAPAAAGPQVAETADQGATGVLPASAEAASPAPAEETASDEEIDAELLEIFLEEANEVLGTIAENLDLLKAQPSNLEALTTMRRAFHTLKGSSRMVGLREFGEVAWVVEQVHNLWLRQERTPDLNFFKLVQLSHEVFSAWVAHLASGEGSLPDASALVEMGEALKGGETVTLAPKSPAAAPAVEAAPAAEETIELGDVAETPDSELTLDLAPTETAPAADDELSISFDDAEGSESELVIDLGDATIEALPEAEAEPADQPATIAGEDLGQGAQDTEPDQAALVEADLPEISLDFPASEFAAEASGPDTADGLAVEDSALPTPASDADAPAHEAGDSEALIALDLPALDEGAELSATADSTATEDEAPIEAAAEAHAEDESVPVLFQIFLEEARSHLQTLLRAFGEIELDPTMPAPPDMIRSAHTLGSIGGTVGFTVVKALGHGLESALLRRSHMRGPANLEALEVIREVIAELEDMVVTIASGKTPEDRPLLVAAIGGIYADAEPAENAEADLLAATSVIQPEAPESAGPLELPADELDESLLPIFIEEAGDLVGAVNERLGMWQAKPDDVNTIHALARLLHTLKGSARMAGALGIGALTHTLETMVEAAHHRGSADPAEIARFQGEFDEIAERIAALSPLAVEPEFADPAMELAPPDGAADEASPAETPAPPRETAAPAVPPPATEPPLSAAISPPLAPPRPTPVPLPADSLDEDLLPIFLEESTELVKTIYAQLDAWRASPADEAAQHALARALHTLKGSARMAGAMSIGALTHTLEARVEELTKSGQADTGAIFDVQGGFDTIAGVIERLQQGEALSEITVDAPGEPTAAEPALPEPAKPPVEPARPAEAKVTPISATTADESAAIAPSAAAPIAPQRAQSDALARPMLRVRAELIDRLVNDAGELSIARARIEGEMRGLKQAMLDLTENVIRLRRQLREIEIQAESQLQSRIALASETAASFDPLELDRFTRFQELTRMMAESVNDVATVQQSLLKSLDESNAALANQGRLNRELQQALMSVRMVPFAGIVERLYRITRQTAKETGKRADLEVHGSQIELDQNIINKMIGPLEHLLRNAVSHGIEPPDRRVAAGKADIGEITLTLRQEGNEVIITMQDDGAGLDLERIREKAVAKGLIGAQQKIDPRELTDFIFHSGFSTATKVTQVSGRGVGMDVVRSEVGDLGGRIEVQSETGKGTTFRVYLPLTLAVTNAALVRIGSRSFAIPASMIDQVMEVKVDTLTQMRDAGKVSWQGADYPFHFLPHLLGDPGALAEARKFYWVLLLHSGAQRVAVQVDELTGSQEVVVKNIGPQLARVVGIAGATVLGDGRVLLILNPVALAARPPVIGPTIGTPSAAEAEEEAAVLLPTVLVVDDSLTVRKITSRLLAREGYQVVTAKDGVDALQQMTEFVPDVILSDIEMPRMDGFELARNIRSDERLREIPIVMITSRTADKHRTHAAELGVDHFLGKPYQEEELLKLVGDYTAHKRVTA